MTGTRENTTACDSDALTIVFPDSYCYHTLSIFIRKTRGCAIDSGWFRRNRHSVHAIGSRGVVPYALGVPQSKQADR